MKSNIKFTLLSWTDEVETNKVLSSVCQDLDVTYVNVTDKMDFLEEILDYDINLIIFHINTVQDECIQVMQMLQHDSFSQEIPILIISNLNNNEQLALEVAVYPVIAIFNYVNWKYQVTSLIKVLTHTQRQTEVLNEDLLNTKENNFLDPLTGALNRRGCERAFEFLVGYHASNEEAFSLIMLDIDHFKKVNDTYGHEVGDEVLVELALIIKNDMGKDDSFIRFGGEEFVILLSDSDLELTKKKAEEIRKKIAMTRVSHKNLSITASFGLVSYSSGQTLEKMVNQADAFLYKAKSGGRNQVVSS